MRAYTDTVFISLPRILAVTFDDPQYTTELAVLVSRLSLMAEAQLLAQYPHSTMVSVEWQFFLDVDQARKMELPHQCADCQEGKDRAIIILRDDPAHIVAFGTMHCEEPDRDPRKVRGTRV